jgi:hypothetical protein
LTSDDDPLLTIVETIRGPDFCRRWAIAFDQAKHRWATRPVLIDEEFQ